MGPLLHSPSWQPGGFLLRVRSHSGPCLDLLQSGIVRTSSRPLKGPAAVARPPSCVVAISICLSSASGRELGIRTTKLSNGQLKLISSPMGNLVFYGHSARSHGLHGPTRHPTAGANRQNDQKRPSCAHGRSANSRYAIQAAKGGHMSRLVRWS